MINIILVSHGSFCEGMLSGLEMIAGGDYGVRAVPLTPGESPESYRAKLSKVIKENIDQNSGTIILSDIAGGTPYLSAAYLSKDYKICLIANVINAGFGKD